MGYCGVVHLSVGNDVEMPHHPRRDVGSASTRRTQRSQQNNVLDFYELLVLPVVPATVVQELAQQLNGRLGAILLFLGHVQVVHEYDVLLANGCPVHSPPDFLQLQIYSVLGLIG